MAAEDAAVADRRYSFESAEVGHGRILAANGKPILVTRGPGERQACPAPGIVVSAGISHQGVGRAGLMLF